MNTALHLEDLNPIIREHVLDRDGIETYVLYVLVFTCIILSFFILSFYRILLYRSDIPICKISYWLLFVLLILNACLFFCNAGFYPPMAQRYPSLWIYPLSVIGTVILYYLFNLSLRFEKTSITTISILLIPACFIATMQMSLFDLSYVFAPALRMIHHFKLSEIYFQYDLLLSLIAWAWMKMHIDLKYIQLLAEFSLYIFLLGSFFFSKRLFLKKELSYYLLATLVLIKIYAPMVDPVYCFQVTPLRLDWWLVLAVLTYGKGLYSRYTGIALGILIILHRTFGTIYAICYLETVSVLFLLDFIRNIHDAGSFKLTLQKHFKYNIVNFIIVAVAMAIGGLLFGSSLESAKIFRDIGIGFMPIARTSFYWHIAVLISATAIFLYAQKKKLTEQYFVTCLFLLLLAIGNSIYFFGRSHENNIINIAGSLVFVLFILLDLLSLRYDHKGERDILKKLYVTAPPCIILLLLMIFYSGKAYSVTEIKIENIKKHQFVYDIRSLDADIGQIRKLTHDSPKIYFIGANDFYYYYYGNYIPQGHFSPSTSWIFKKDLVRFIQGLIDDGYYVVSIKQNGRFSDMNDEILVDLKFPQSRPPIIGK